MNRIYLYFVNKHLSSWALLGLKGLQSTRRCYIQNIKALGLPVSEKKNYENGFSVPYIPTCDPRGRASFDPRGFIMNKLGRGLQENAIYQISKL